MSEGSERGESAGAWPRTRWSAPLRGYPADSSGPGYRTARRLFVAGRLDRRRIGFLRGRITETATAEQEDFRVLHQTIGDGCRNGGVVEDVTPVGECSIRRDNGGAFVTMACRDHLIEEIGTLLIKR